MAEKNKEDKMILEREYVVPLRRKWQNTPGYKRVPKAVKALKEFIAKHMKIYDRDLDKVKLDRYLNEEMWMRSIRKPLAKVKIKAKKFDSGIVKVELAEIPQFLKFKIEKDKRIQERLEKTEGEKKKEEEKKEPKAEEKKESDEKKEEQKDKKEAVIESGMKHAEEQAKQMKHEAKTKQGPRHQRRMALQK
jgi:large subunit ribosomal protein L31e